MLLGILIRLMTGSSKVDIETILEHRVRDTTLRTRRDEWMAAGVFDQLGDEGTGPNSVALERSTGTPQSARDGYGVGHQIANPVSRHRSRSGPTAIISRG